MKKKYNINFNVLRYAFIMYIVSISISCSQHYSQKMMKNPSEDSENEKYEGTILHEAVKASDVDINVIKFLININKVDLNAKDTLGKSAMEYVDEKGPIYKLLVDSGAIPNSYNEIIANIVSDNIESLKNIIKDDPKKLEIKAPNGNTVMHMAIEKQSKKTIEYLALINPNLLFIKNSNNQTPFEYYLSQSSKFTLYLHELIIKNSTPAKPNNDSPDKKLENESPEEKESSDEESSKKKI